MKIATKRRPRLAQVLVDDLRGQIETGMLAVGAQLPTEPQLEERFSVSRTVVREAIAELRAAGLVTPIQGKGMFVTDLLDLPAVTLTPVELQSVPQTLELIEFRIGVEVEAAGIAAYRRSASQEEAIRMANHEMALKIERGEQTVEVDFLFHMAIAMATNNRYFSEALNRFGQRSIPRGQFPTLPDANGRQYLSGVLAEHERILDAIADQDPEAARIAMREHLVASQKRYRRLAR
ncbi:FadR/GntR family transcriptional regulator [Agrobacterium sp. NPDC089420]|uniref:FadR/GntR family transcriptional regulator n=1 Tax=Agrobacterium sp. NPDC089420 TaxID=3363918 RepID=UPI003850E689